MDEWIDGRTDGWMDGWVDDGRIEKQNPSIISVWCLLPGSFDGVLGICCSHKVPRFCISFYALLLSANGESGSETRKFRGFGRLLVEFLLLHFSVFWFVLCFLLFLLWSSAVMRSRFRSLVRS